MKDADQNSGRYRDVDLALSSGRKNVRSNYDAVVRAAHISAEPPKNLNTTIHYLRGPADGHNACRMTAKVNRGGTVMNSRSLIVSLALAVIMAAAAVSTRAATPKPFFTEYRGVSIGMTADQARKKLGEPKERSDTQEYFEFSDSETAQVYYDENLKVRALSIMFMGDLSSAPVPKAIFGTDADAKDDGSIYRIERYPEAGFFVSYTRTAGDTPIVVIAMQKI
jgi:hypothetical protein